MRFPPLPIPLLARSQTLSKAPVASPEGLAVELASHLALPEGLVVELA